MFEKKHKLLASALAAGLAVTVGGVSTASAAMYNINSDPADYALTQPSSANNSTDPSDITVDATGPNVRIGQYNDGNDYNGVFVFELPDIGGAGHEVDSASLRVIYSFKQFSENVVGDLYGIGNFPGTTDPINDFYEGTNGGDPSATFLLGSYINQGNAGGAVDRNIANLPAYLNSFYDTHPGYTGGNYAFLRINPRGEIDTNSFHQLTTAEKASSSPLDPASLSFTTVAVPEPASLALLGLGGLVMLGRRRRA